MKKAAFCAVLLAIGMTGCSESTVQRNEDLYPCSHNGLTFYCSDTAACGPGFCLGSTEEQCGESLSACGSFEKCINYACMCKTNDNWSTCSNTCCGDGCKDTRVDPNNCGACGKKCDAGQLCIDGDCKTECSENLEKCTKDGVTSCFDTKNDVENCGGCGIACPKGDEGAHFSKSICVEGKCSLICTGGWIDADGNAANGCEKVSDAVCGNGVVEPGEMCDGSRLNDQTCETVVGSGSKGTLLCASDCHSFMTTYCTAASSCGNDDLDEGEACDGMIFTGTCEGLVGEGSTGKLLCSQNCTFIDTTGCSAPKTCGNGSIDPGEKCDGDLDESITCASVVGVGSKGTIKCAENCAAYDISHCTAAYVCGNGIREPGEECDGNDMGEVTCSTAIGAGSIGKLSCDSQCKVNASLCSPPSTCGNGKIDGNDVCDGNLLNGQTCASVLGKGSQGTLKCSSNCSSFDISSCSAPASCNNGKIENSEVCDGRLLNDKTCADFKGEGSTGTLICNDKCTGYDTKGCTAPTKCGNGKIDTDEMCDGDSINSMTCEKGVGKGSSGKVRCSPDCRSFDYSMCSAPQLCGNGKLDVIAGEVCDGTNLNGKTCASILGEGATGTLSCGDGCMHFNLNNCKAPVICGDGIIHAGEICDATNLAGRTCADKDALGEGAYGTLRCNSTCNGLDTSSCHEKPAVSGATCGNGKLEAGEACDLNDFGGATCKSELGNASATGSLKCSPDCKSIITSACEFCGDRKLKSDGSEECDGTDWAVSNCVEYDPKKYSGGTLKCNTSTCELDPAECTLISASYECEENAYSCVGSTLRMCDDHRWQAYYECGSEEKPSPYCSAKQGDCIRTSWCNTQHVGKNSAGVWEAYSRIRKSSGWDVNDPDSMIISMRCTQHLDYDVWDWEMEFLDFEQNKSCADCGSNNVEFVSKGFTMPKGKSYCAVSYFFDDNWFVCLPNKSGESEPVLLNKGVKLDASTSFVVNN